MIKRKRCPMTAEEHEAILQADPEYQARKRAADRRHEEFVKLIRKDARPLIAALWAVSSKAAGTSSSKDSKLGSPARNCSACSGVIRRISSGVIQM